MTSLLREQIFTLFSDRTQVQKIFATGRATGAVQLV